MKYWIIIRGPLGIGKTTISKKLAKIVNGIYISIDCVLEENGLDREDNAFIPEDFIKANEIAICKLSEEIKKDSILIFDGNFYFKEQIEHLEKNLKGKYFIFNLKACVEECIKRDSGRKRVYGE